MQKHAVSFAIVLIVSSLFAKEAAAQTYCSGTINAVYLTSDGDVVLEGSWRGDYTEICNDQGTFGGIDQVTCLSWYAAAVKAETAQSKVMVTYNNDGYTCNNLPTYANSIVPFYFMNTQ